MAFGLGPLGGRCTWHLWQWVPLGPGPGRHRSQTVRTPSAWLPALPTCVFSPAASPAGVLCFGKMGALAGWHADTWPVTQRHVTSSPQIQKWGNIEWAHDYELRELRARTAAGTLFVHLCSESATVKHKLLQQ